jgi:dihydroxyacetone kinase-like protein
LRKIINNPRNFVDEMIEGILEAHADQIGCVNNNLRCLVRSNKKNTGKVGLSTGGGSGHLPLFLGYVGKGMLDGCAVGNVFASPSSKQILEVTRAINSGNGVLCIYGNYSGDVMNFDMAAEMADMEAIKVEQIIVGDDIISSPKGQENKRRGVAGIFFVYKIAGAYAEEMASLDEVKRIAEKTSINVRTMGVGLSPCTLPEVGQPTFEMKEGEMEIGIGIHGEPGIGKGKLEPADKIVEKIMDSIIEDLPYKRGDEVSVLINGLGATPREELYIVYRKVAQILKKKGIIIYHPYIGEFATSMEMAGISVSLLKLDHELKNLLKKSARTPFFEQMEFR